VIRRFLSPRHIATVVWSGWLATVIVVLTLWWRESLHPWFLLMGLSLLMQIIAAATLLFVAGWRVLCGPSRRRAAVWLLLGLGPIWFDAAFGTFVVWRAASRNWEFPLRLGRAAKIVAAALGDAELRWRFPYRYESRHAVLWSPREIQAQPELDALDRHLDRMDDVLGRRSRGKVYWVRGTLLGQSGASFCGLALGSSVETQTSGTGELAELDRHETAHFAIDQHLPWSATPPTLLVEGWAESQSGYKPGELAVRAWRKKDHGDVWTLSELTGDSWYNRAFAPVYDQGGPLVDYVLRTYGGEKFYELYSTCRRDTFAADCQRILSVTLDELDRAYWQDIDRQVSTPECRAQIQPLLHARLANGVNRTQWNKIALLHWEAREAARQRYRQARFTEELVLEDRRVPPQTIRLRSEVACDGPRSRLVQRTVASGREESVVLVATPEQSFRLEKHAGATGWDLIEGGPTGLPSYDRSRRSMQQTGLKDDLPGMCYIDEDWVTLIGRHDWTITALKPIEENGRKLWRFEFTSDTDQYNQPLPYSGWVELDPEENWAVHSLRLRETFEGGAPETRTRTTHYGPKLAGVSCLQELRNEWTKPSGEIIRRSTLTVSDRHFEPTPIDEFTLSAFGVRPDQLTYSAGMPWWVQLPIAGFILSMLGGTALGCLGRREHPLPDSRA
jgi:hypothetical protein